jgi:ribosomal protein S18 acetylase RimI-like enzyme
MASLPSARVEVRRVDAADVDLCRRLGEIVRESYVTLPGHIDEPDYEAELADVATRAGLPETIVMAAFDGDRVLGCVTYVESSTSPMAEDVAEGEASFRMLGVDPAAQGKGVGRLLVSWCIEQARADGRTAIVMHTTPWMRTAHRLYETFGFVRDESRDWEPVPGIDLLGYRMDLSR